MDLEFSHSGKAYSIALEKTGTDDFKAVIGGRELSFGSSQISANSFSVLLDGQSKLVYVAESNSSLFVHIDGQTIKLEKAIGDKNNFAGAGDVFGAKDEVSTPMPGKIVKILVAKGDQVKAKQPLVIVESMKMENKIVSPSDGEVKSIHFGDGDLVEPGQPIIRLIPAK